MGGWQIMVNGTTSVPVWASWMDAGISQKLRLFRRGNAMSGAPSGDLSAVEVWEIGMDGDLHVAFGL
jgi:hypothetical protein